MLGGSKLSYVVSLEQETGKAFMDVLPRVQIHSELIFRIGSFLFGATLPTLNYKRKGLFYGG